MNLESLDSIENDHPHNCLLDTYWLVIRTKAQYTYFPTVDFCIRNEVFV